MTPELEDITEVELRRRRKFGEVDVTLNGRPARVVGYRNKFATVWTMDGLTPQEANFSWAAVKHVIETNAGGFVA